MITRFSGIIKSIAVYVVVIVAGAACGWAATHAKEWFTPDFRSGDYQSYYAGQGPKVALYGTSWCPACAAARDTLTAMGVSYSDFDIEKSEEAKKRYMNTGESAIPLIFIQDRMFVGVDKTSLEKTIREYGLGKKAI